MDLPVLSSIVTVSLVHFIKNLPRARQPGSFPDRSLQRVSFSNALPLALRHRSGLPDELHVGGERVGRALFRVSEVFRSWAVHVPCLPSTTALLFSLPPLARIGVSTVARSCTSLYFVGRRRIVEVCLSVTLRVWWLRRSQAVSAGTWDEVRSRGVKVSRR